MLGIIPNDYWQPMPQDAINIEFLPMEKWAGKRMSLAGIFHSIDQTKTVNGFFTILWNNGYTPFVNIYFNDSAYNIAKGNQDANIHAWAKDFAAYAQGGTRMAFLAPMQEMNGYWVPYGQDPGNFKIAFQRVVQIFAQEGVDDDSVRWVFAPNGWGSPPFTTYYPGDSLVDVLAISTYNFGYHPGNPYKDWLSPQETFITYLDQLRAMAPTKPIFIAQTATTAYYSDGFNVGKKNEWLSNSYELLAKYKGVRAVIYYNPNEQNDYDWAYWRPGGVAYEGFRDGIADPAYGYISPQTLMDLDLSP
jgi:beta-mannanase